MFKIAFIWLSHAYRLQIQFCFENEKKHNFPTCELLADIHVKMSDGTLFVAVHIKTKMQSSCAVTS